MSKKLEYGLCIFYQAAHYFIPSGKEKQSHLGDVYFIIGDREKGGHISFHKSGKIQYKDLEEIIPIKKEDVIEVVLTPLKSLQELTPFERKFILRFIDYLKPGLNFNGCFEPNCKNRKGFAINYDIIKGNILDYFNKYREIAIQILGEPENIIDDEEDDYEEENIFTPILNKMKIERIPECKYCKNKPRVLYKKKKLIWNNCTRCKGLGFDQQYLEKYKVN